MIKLKLNKINKSYKAGDKYLHVLKDITLLFRESEFVSILGPSGSGKTTLLNIIGGLDHYDSGDLIINNQSTKHFNDKDWDSYRNRSIGFVFQNYNLIGHQSILQNVEIAMTLSGVSTVERKKRATKALEDVGLIDHINKKPNQLSGGQMQRVAIARALVNNPDIILADEPTGALDSKTSEQVMAILRDISKTKLVIMVTHNEETALAYSTRIIRFLDGFIQSDSDMLEETSASEVVKMAEKTKRTSMSLMTALTLSFKNLLTKKGRTLLTAFAGSIGIIGVALVLALSAGLSDELQTIQTEALSNSPITISTQEQFADLSTARPPTGDENSEDLVRNPDDEALLNYNLAESMSLHKNVITDDFIDYVGQMEEDLSDSIDRVNYRQGVVTNMIAQGDDNFTKFDTTATLLNESFGPPVMTSTHWQELNVTEEILLETYEFIGADSRFPESEDELLLVVDPYNRLTTVFLNKLGLDESADYQVADFIGKDVLKVVPNDDFYEETNGIYREIPATSYEEIYHSEVGKTLTITGVIRLKEGEESGVFQEGFVYQSELVEYVLSDASTSEIAEAQREEDVNVLTNQPFKDTDEKEDLMVYLGAESRPVSIDIYASNFEEKEKIKSYLDDYNSDKEDDNQILYTDLSEFIGSFLTTLIDTVTYVLIGFATISLIVSTIMIGIITYVSVIERTKEIGILRSVGARKKDISRVFNAETLIVGFISGGLGVGISYGLLIPINYVIENLTETANLASLNVVTAVVLILGSMLLTLIGGVIPSKMAAKKDPVAALRSE